MAFNPFDMFPPNTKEFAAFVSVIQAITSQLVDHFRFVKGANKGFVT